ncbi:hypothetical protein TPENAI_70079 [Tenacibaculum litopenaei]|uniref:hypothetical protein n=1 Tax=Tenacibaculum litopenaei TaxID=396016 RepID=UPI00389438BC
MLFTIAGLLINCIGICLLFYYGAPSSRLPENTGLSHSVGVSKSLNSTSRYGIALISLGTVLQVVGTVVLSIYQ